MRFRFWRGRIPPIRPQLKTAEEEGEEYLLSLEMHYGDEPLYFSDPPEWPQYGDTVGVLRNPVLSEEERK